MLGHCNAAKTPDVHGTYRLYQECGIGLRSRASYELLWDVEREAVTDIEVDAAHESTAFGDVHA